MFFIKDFGGIGDVIILNIPREAITIAVKLNIIFVLLIGVEVVAIRAKPSNGRHVEKCGCQHSARKLKGVSLALLIVKVEDKRVLAIRRDNPQQLDQVEDVHLFSDSIHFGFYLI